MGFLYKGSPPMTWEEMQQILDYIREHGIIQFINLYNKHKEFQSPELRWGDEIEFTLVTLNRENSQPMVLNVADQAIEMLQKFENEHNGSNGWHHEYGRWMVEAIPSAPYTNQLGSLLNAEDNMALRRKKLQAFVKHIDPTGEAVTVSVFPLLGVGDYFTPNAGNVAGNHASMSVHSHDEVINPHPRFPTLTRHIRQRHGFPVTAIHAPIYKDTNTTEEDIYADASVFGMGQCCLQITLNSCCFQEALHLYDQLLPLTGVMLAATANQPYFRGMLQDWDTRWKILEQAMDDRTEEERNGKYDRGRYSGACFYLSEKTCTHYNDVPQPHNEMVQKMLADAGIHQNLADHLSYVFSRDPLVVFPERVELDDNTETDHFENIYSTNWNSMRFKPPPGFDSDIGWRVEFRTMDLQLTDFENAAYSIFLVLLSRAILTFNLSMQIPISLVDINMERALQRDAVTTQKFWFKTNIVPADSLVKEFTACPVAAWEDEISELTLDEIFNGKADEFEGLIPLVRLYLGKVVQPPEESVKQLCQYLNFLSKRVNGEIPTGAHWQREYIINHAEYNKDSVITPGIAFDLLEKCSRDCTYNEDLLGPRCQCQEL